MRHFFSRLGRIKSVIILTWIAVILAIFFTLLFEYIFSRAGMDVYPVTAIIISLGVALIVAPLMSWYLIGLLLQIHDLEEQMRILATIDQLTGLLSRHEFLERSQHCLHYAQREGAGFSIVLMDIDHFKPVNDQFGHHVGDQVLSLFGKAILSSARQSDLACRYGGDEFIFFLPNASAAKAGFFAARLHKAIAKIDYAGAVPHPVTASIGIVTGPQPGAGSLEALIKAADTALYRAKHDGRNQTQIYNPEWTVKINPQSA